jgi:general secretion pathway protein L
MARYARYRLIDLSTGEAAIFGAGAAGFARLEASDSRAPLVALVPADRCSVVRVDVPEMSAGRLAQALRWAVEDAIAGDPEQQHVVPVRRAQDGRLVCMVAARADMHQWIEAAGERPALVLPDAACVPRQDGEVVLLPRGDRVLARGANEDFDRLEPDLLDVMVPELLDACGDSPRLVWLGDSLPDELPEAEPRSIDKPALDELAAVALGVDARPLNLMRGDFAPADPSASAGQWKRVMALAVAALVLLCAVAFGEYWVVERERQRLTEQVESRFAEVFPSITTLVRPRAQAERALAELRGGGSDRFVSLLGAVSPLFSGADGVEIISLRFADSRAEIELRTPGLADLETLQRQLQARGIRADLGNVEVRSDRAGGVLTVGGERQ